MPTLILSEYVEPAYARELIATGGGTGYLLKERISRPHDFVDALITVAHGGNVLDPEAVTTMLNNHHTRTALDSLTDRKRDVLQHMSRAGPTPPSRRLSPSPRPRSRSTSARSSASSDCRPPTPTIGGSAPS